MDFKKLKYILKVTEEQSISKAAANLYISQPSLSHIISKFETELGIKIFDRTTAPISLTYAGERLVAAAKEILNIDDNLKKEFSDIGDMIKGKISIGIPSLRGSFMLPHVLPLFHEKYPGIELSLLEENSQQLEDFLLKGKVDIVFTVVPPSDNNIVYEMIGKEQIKLACKKGYLSKEYIIEGTENVVDFPKLKDFNFILTKKGHRIRDYVEKIFDKYDFKPNILLETSNSGTAYRLATVGMGLCFASEVTIHSTKTIGEYDLFEVDNPSVGWEIGAMYRKDVYITRAERYLIDIMREVLVKSDKGEYDF